MKNSAQTIFLDTHCADFVYNVNMSFGYTKPEGSAFLVHKSLLDVT